MIKCWCMTPIKKSSTKVQESFRRGKLAENLCAKHISSFIRDNTNEDLTVEFIIETGLLKNKCNNVAAVSPDNIAIIKICNATTKVGKKILKIMEDNCYYDSALQDSGIHAFMCCLEYKNKNSEITLNKARYIVEVDLKKELVVVIDLSIQDNIQLFHKIVPEPDYRFQILHELVISEVYFNLYVVTTSKIEYAVFVYIPPEIRDMYKIMMADIEKNLSFVDVQR